MKGKIPPFLPLGIERHGIEKSLIWLTQSQYVEVINSRGVSSSRSPNKYKLGKNEDIALWLEEVVLDPLAKIAKYVGLSYRQVLAYIATIPKCSGTWRK